MKKRLFAVLMAVCLVFGTCTLFASAAIDAGKYLKGDESALKIATEGTDFNKSLSITAKSGATLPLGTTTLTAENIDDVFTFKSGSSTVKYEGNLDQYITITATVDASGNVEITGAEQKKTITIYEVSTKIDADAPIKYDDYKENLIKDEKHIYKDADVLALEGTKNTVTFVAKLHSLTTGVRFFGSTYNNLVASEIAQVTAVYTRNGGEPVTSVTNKVEDLMTGETVSLTASLKDIETNSKFYKFYCWVDGSGTVLETNETITWTAGSSPSAVYATYVEIVDRVRINYSAGENGSIVYNESREVFKGEGQVSVLEGKEATFTFVPDEGYEVAKVIINGDKDVASFLSVFDGGFSLEALKDLINATNKEVYSYTFTAEQLTGDIDVIRSVEVTFQKVAALETPTGKDLPTVAPEGITLATGVAGDEAEGGEGADATTVPAENNASNGGSDDGIVNPQTGSASVVAVFAVLSVAAGAAFVTSRKKD